MVQMVAAEQVARPIPVMVEHMAEAEAGLALLSLAVKEELVAALAQFALSGPVTLERSHQPIRVMCNETIYSNS
jgi:hypothetical protein